MHRVDHSDDVIDWSFGQDTVAEIENVPWPTGGAPENFADATFDFFGRREQRDRIEITLHRDIMSDGAPAFIQIYPPVEPDHIATRSANVLQ